MEEVYEPKLAPVIIPTLNRIDHLKRCIDSLSNCVLALQTDLIIGLDYPFKEEHLDGYNKICSYLDRGIKGFNSVTILKREVNFGPQKNIDDLRNYVFSFSDCVICSEDDNVFSPNFLIYINKGLVEFKDNKNIFAVCGYNYPIDIQLYYSEIFAAHVFCAWGYGIWKDRVNILESSRNVEFLHKVAYSKETLSRFLKYGCLEIYTNCLKACLGKYNLYGDLIITSLLMHKDFKCVYPKISLVKNYGFDGTGLHCHEIKAQNNIFMNQEVSSASNFHWPDNLEFSLDPYIVRKLRKYFKNSWFSYIKSISKFFIYHFVLLLKK